MPPKATLTNCIPRQTAKIGLFCFKASSIRANSNSYHHQALHTLGKDLRVTAWSSDGLAEAVESTNEQQPLLAVQWHPELMYARDAKSQALFNYFVQKL